MVNILPAAERTIALTNGVVGRTGCAIKNSEVKGRHRLSVKRKCVYIQYIISHVQEPVKLTHLKTMRAKRSLQVTPIPKKSEVKSDAGYLIEVLT